MSKGKPNARSTVIPTWPPNVRARFCEGASEGTLGQVGMPRSAGALGPRLIVDYARYGHLSHEEARTLITTTSPHRSCENSPRVTQLLPYLEE